MTDITDVVQVVIEQGTNQVAVEDLNTIAILSQHQRFTDDSRVYTSAAALITDGFLTTDFAYKAALAIFQQPNAADHIVVGRIAGAGSPTVWESYTLGIERLRASDDQWGYLITDATEQADVLEVAGVIETTEKWYVWSSSEAGTLASTTTDTIAMLAAEKYNRTRVMFNENTNNTVPEAAWAGYFAPLQVGSTLWIYKPLVGVLPSKLTATQETNLKTKNANWYTTISGSEVMYGNNVVSSGKYIDNQDGIQWIITRMREAVFGAIINTRKVNYDVGGVAAIESAVRTVIQEAIGYNILDAQPAPQIVTPNVLGFTSAQRNTRNLTGVQFTARLAGGIQSVLNIQGTVYA